MAASQQAHLFRFQQSRPDGPLSPVFLHIHEVQFDLATSEGLTFDPHPLCLQLDMEQGRGRSIAPGTAAPTHSPTGVCRTPPTEGMCVNRVRPGLARLHMSSQALTGRFWKGTSVPTTWSPTHGWSLESKDKAKKSDCRCRLSWLEQMLHGTSIQTVEMAATKNWINNWSSTRIKLHLEIVTVCLKF